ncbi:substrate-binding periplasmic protein [Kiloniella antarctica]|uniref:Substrate-binding periplasmic protein n=1 Tax=Kiloniella antarctica TaxID=1550907 RepID=A0ABW5BDJ0_9PROT
MGISYRFKKISSSLVQAKNLLIVFGFLLSTSAYAGGNYTLYSYHNVPPFVTGKDTGLTYDLAKHLTHNSTSGHKYSVRILPRKRLDELMAKKSIIVPWVTPIWFKTLTSPETNWSSPIMMDSSVYVWKTGKDKSYKAPEDLIGSKLGGIRGYKYAGVDPLVKDNKIRRTNTNSEWQLLQMLLSERVDVGIMPEAGVCNLIKTQGLVGQLKITQHHNFTRKIMITGSSQKHLIPELNNLENNPVWTTTLSRYGTHITPLDNRNEDNYCDVLAAKTGLILN